MYIRTHLLRNYKDEWVITLFTDDDVKVKATIVKGYKEALRQSSKLSEENNNCEYTVGNISYNGNKI